MLSQVGFGKKLFVAAILAGLGLGAQARHASAGSVTFANFQDLTVGQWSYANSTGLLTGSGTASFISFGPPSQILNYTGLVTEALSASVTGAAVNNAGTLSQGITGTLTFTNGVNTVLSVSFVGAVLSGPAGSQSTNTSADNAVISGQITSYTSSPLYQVAPFVNPFSFSISLTQVPGLNIATSGNLNNFADFRATAQGSFSADAGTGALPTPLPAAVWGGMALMGAVGSVSMWRRRRQI